MRLKPRFFKSRALLLGTLSPLIAARIACAEPAANALPTGFSTTGAAAMTTSGNTMTVTQTDSRVIIDWQRFDIGHDARVDFAQPGSRSIAINRVTNSSGDPSQIYGQLNAHGTVVILDRNGIVFGTGAKIDTSGIIASTGTLANPADFLSGSHPVFNDIAAQSGARIDNHGEITVRGAGLAAFVAPAVHNSGIIRARLGSVTLASGDTATLDMYGDGLWSIEVTGALAGNIERLRNSGIIEADGGSVFLSVRTAQTAANNVINNTGVISAQRFAQKDGKIILSPAAGATDRKNNAVLAGASADLQSVFDTAAQDGSTEVHLASGNYHGNFVLHRTVALVGEDNNDQPHLIADTDVPALRIAANSVSIRNIRITGGLLADGVAGLRVANSALVQAAGSTGQALTLVHTTGAVFDQNYFSHYGSGGPVTLTSTTGSVFTGNYFSGMGDFAVSATGGSKPQIDESNMFIGSFTTPFLWTPVAQINDNRTSTRPPAVELPKAEAEIIILDAASLASIAPAAGDETAQDCETPQSCH